VVARSAELNLGRVMTPQPTKPQDPAPIANPTTPRQGALHRPPRALPSLPAGRTRPGGGALPSARSVAQGPRARALGAAEADSPAPARAGGPAVRGCAWQCQHEAGGGCGRGGRAGAVHLQPLRPETTGGGGCSGGGERCGGVGE